MYGQKQILQCLAVAIILAVFSFHRAAIKRNREVTKSKLIRKIINPSLKIKQQIDVENVSVLNGNYTGYSIRYPFGKNVYVNHDFNVICQHKCFDKFELWLRKQCQANCCIKKQHPTPINLPTTQFKTAELNGDLQYRTRKAENALMKYNGENSASLHNKQYKPEKTIMDPITEKLMSVKRINPGEEEYECKIQTNVVDDEFTCKNTTSVTVDFVKLETINKTQITMEYHDFLFDMGGPPETKTGSTQSFDRSMSSAFLAFISLLVAMFTIRIMYKLFMTDHTEAFLRVIEMRRNLHDRLEQIQAELQARENEANNNTIANNNSATERRDDEADNDANSTINSDNTGDKENRDVDVTSKQETSDQSE